MIFGWTKPELGGVSSEMMNAGSGLAGGDRTAWSLECRSFAASLPLLWGDGASCDPRRLGAGAKDAGFRGEGDGPLTGVGEAALDGALLAARLMLRLAGRVGDLAPAPTLVRPDFRARASIVPATRPSPASLPSCRSTRSKMFSEGNCIA